MRMTSELTSGWKRLRVFIKLLMRRLLRVMRTKCTRLVVSMDIESNLNVSFAVCD